jgi:hypothetical protein
MSFSARHAAALAIGFTALTAAMPVCADTGPVYVVPSRPGIPVPINGRDASWSVVEGDIGLARPGHLTPVIIGGGRPLPPRWSYHGKPYFPRYGTAPHRGRYEADLADRPQPEPAEPYFRSWSTSSDGQINNRQVRMGAPLPPQSPQLPPEQYQAPPYSVESENLPATIENQPFPMAPPIVVVPRRP